MSPEEVGGLKQVGDSLGIKMSTNPYTGMPEAFSFGDFFTSFLPTIVGAAVGGPGGAGIMSQMTPILAGAGTGALLAAAKGDDPLMGGLTGGLGGYGGSQLGQSFGKAFGGTGGTTAGSVGELINQGAQQMTGGGAGNLGMFATNLTGATPTLGAANFAPGVAQVGSSVGTIPQIGGAANLGSAIPVDKAIAPTAGGAASTSMAENLGNVGSGIKNLTGFGDMSIGDAYSKFTSPAVGGSAGQLAMPIGGALLAGLEPSDLGYGTGNLYEDPEKGKYRGPQGQLNLSDKFDTGLRLVAKGGAIKSYALGGNVANQSVGAGLSALYNPADGSNTPNISQDGYGLGRLSNLASAQEMDQAKTFGYADGGDVGMNLDELPSLNLNFVTRPSVSSSGNSSATQNILGNMGRMGPVGIGMQGGINPPTWFEQQKNMGNFSSNMSGINAAQPKSYALNLNSGQQEAQYAQGGYLDGAGDGMSDSIPATIEGKQPARLADGEFVVPADVVSHLGNGSSKAGSKRLYAMLDKVRHARTGNKKQGKEINPAKYMPA
jgi:hypothetical protein